MAKHTEILERYGKFKRENSQFLHCNYSFTNVGEDFSKCVLDVKNEADILHKSKIVCTFIKCISYANGNNNGIVVAQNSSQNDLQSRNQMKRQRSSCRRGRLLAFTIITALAALISSHRSAAAPFSILQ